MLINVEKESNEEKIEVNREELEIMTACTLIA